MKIKVAHALSQGGASNHQEDKGNAAFPKDSFSQPTLALAEQTSSAWAIAPNMIRCCVHSSAWLPKDEMWQ